MIDHLIITYIIVSICMIVNSYYDIKSRNTYTMLYAIGTLGTLCFGDYKLIAAIALLVILWSEDGKWCGGGDIDAFVLTLATVGIYKTFYLFLTATILSLIWMIVAYIYNNRKHLETNIRVISKDIPFAGLLGIVMVMNTFIYIIK